MLSSNAIPLPGGKLAHLWLSIKGLPIRYPAVISGYIIYAYLFIAMIRFFITTQHAHMNFWDALEIFDALPFMWLLALTLVKVIDTKTLLHKSEQERALKDRELKIRETQLKSMHELKNPFTAISAFAAILHDDHEIQKMPDQREVVQYIIAAGDSALLLINDIFDTNAIESGHLRLSKSHFHIGTMLQSAVLSHQLVAKTKNISIAIDADTSVLSGEMFGDTLRIRQVLDNLISNAIKYSNHNTHITIRPSREQAAVKVEVIDQGQGIPADEMHNLFDDYSKTSIRPTAGESSTGLGLGIVRKIVQEHGGNVGATSEFGKGSNFYFTLPLEAE